MACELWFETIAISNLSLTQSLSDLHYNLFETIAISNLSLTVSQNTIGITMFETIAISNLILTNNDSYLESCSLRLLLFLT